MTGSLPRFTAAPNECVGTYRVLGNAIDVRERLDGFVFGQIGDGRELGCFSIRIAPW